MTAAMASRDMTASGAPARGDPSMAGVGATADKGRTAAAVAAGEARVDDAWFDAPVCRNCGARLETPYCSRCGQPRARRFSWRDLRRETWERWRLFELGQARTLWRLVARPGTVAREYVLGRRKDHVHPLKLLLVLVGLMLLVQGASRYFAHYSWSSRADAQLDRMTGLIQAYANWSFSLGIFAIFGASLLVYRRRLGYNAMEHAVLAVYCQIIIMAALLLNLLPTLVWNSPAFVAAYKDASKWYMYAVKLFIVGLAFRQFFVVGLRREWPRLALAVAVYAVASWLLLRAYAYAILRIVQYQLS